MRIKPSHIVACLVGMALLATAQWILRPRIYRGADATQAPKQIAATEPWGELEITPLVLDRPEELFLTNAWDRVIRWSFPDQSAEQIRTLIGACDLTPEQKASLLATNRWEPLSNGWRILPPVEVVADMSSTSREKIYSVLAQSPLNTNQYWAFFHRADALDTWLSESGLPDDGVNLARRLCYTKHQRVYFGDAQVFELLRSQDEARRLVRTLARVPTLIMKLHLNRESDINTLVNYWGRFRKNDEVDELLRSMSRVPGGASLNVSYFMPPVPRVRLYTYPDADGGVRHDCFWTSFNFFYDQPRHNLQNPADYNALLREGFRPVSGPAQFGDLLLLLESGETAVHMCVYVAADVVYTKNGVDAKQPWVLMHMKDMKALYVADKPLEWRAFRRIDS
ncbi:MAG TPA: hypothetical protein VJ063_00065 [Verrucomicrobiae bacterium]|nr:hypothetical protein [Verrucomicrobiae bacterium]